MKGIKYEVAIGANYLTVSFLTLDRREISRHNRWSAFVVHSFGSPDWI